MKGLLVLTRKTDESVMIGDDIEVVVIDIREDRVRLGFRAPHSVAVHRQEVYREIQAQAAAKATSAASTSEPAA